MPALNRERKGSQSAERDESPLLVVAPDVRRGVSAVAQRYAPGLRVMSYREIDPSVPFVTRGVVAIAIDSRPRGLDSMAPKLTREARL